MTGPTTAWQRKPHPKVHRRLSDTFARPAHGIAGTGGHTPDFGRGEPENNRSAFVSGSLSTLLHVALIGAIAVAAAFAPEVIEEIIQPVTILKELPGSDTPARAGPRSLTPMQAAAPAAAQQVTRVEPVAAAQVSAQALTLEELQAAVAPKHLDRTQVESERVEAKDTDARVQEVVDMAEFKPVTVDTRDLTAPVVQFEAPRQVAKGEVVDISAPQAFQGFVETGAVEYADVATSSAQLTTNTVGVSSQFANVAIGIDASDSGYSGGGGTGSTGGTAGTVSCMESAFVHRYLDTVAERTYSRWLVPRGIAVGEQVVLRFELDAAGSATRIEAIDAANAEFGASAVQALRSASPFPAMNSAVRCLDGKRLKSTFIHRGDQP